MIQDTKSEEPQVLAPGSGTPGSGTPGSGAPGSGAPGSGTHAAKRLNYRLRIIFMVVLVVLFAALTVLMRTGNLTSLESSVYGFFAQNISAPLTQVMILITDLGSPTAIIVIILALIIIPYTRHRFTFPVVFNAALAAILTSALKLIIARDRPNILRLITETGFGFPSGHALSNAAFYAILNLIIFRLTKNRGIRSAAVICGTVLVFFIGISRIYLGVHYAGDILAGWVLGVAIALFSDTLWCYVQSRWPRLLARLPKLLRVK